MSVIEHGGSRIVVTGGVVWQIGKPVASHLRRCYELSADRVGFGPNREAMFTGYKGARLVHGTIQGVGSAPIGHAWVIEPDGESVWEPASNEVYPASVFEALFAAVPHVEYDVTEARCNMARSQHYGPWEV